MIQVLNNSIANNKIHVSVITDETLIKVNLDGVYVKDMAKVGNNFEVDLDLRDRCSISLFSEDGRALYAFVFINQVTNIFELPFQKVDAIIDVPYTTPTFSSIIYATAIISHDKENLYTNGFTDGYILGYHTK